MTPDEVLWLLYRAKLGIVHKQDYSDTLKRSWPGKNGIHIEPSMTVKYTRFANYQKTQLMNYPFRIEIKHVDCQVAADDSHVATGEKKIEMLLSEQTFFTLLNDTVRFIETWVTKLLRQI